MTLIENVLRVIYYHFVNLCIRKCYNTIIKLLADHLFISKKICKILLNAYGFGLLGLYIFAIVMDVLFSILRGKSVIEILQIILSKCCPDFASDVC